MTAFATIPVRGAILANDESAEDATMSYDAFAAKEGAHTLYLYKRKTVTDGAVSISVTLFF